VDSGSILHFSAAAGPDYFSSSVHLVNSLPGMPWQTQLLPKMHNPHINEPSVQMLLTGQK
jgi:hypothetical protein